MVKIKEILLFVIEVILLPIVMLIFYPIGLISWIRNGKKPGYESKNLFIGYNICIKDSIVKSVRENFKRIIGD